MNGAARPLITPISGPSKSVAWSFVVGAWPGRDDDLAQKGPVMHASKPSVYVTRPCLPALTDVNRIGRLVVGYERQSV